MIQDLLDALTPWFEEWGLLIVFLATFLESSLVVASVLPGESVLLLGGFFSAPDAATPGAPPPLEVQDVMLAGFAGAMLGDLVGYMIGRVAGEAIVRRFGRFVFLSPRRVHILQGYFARYGMRAILLGRFAPFLRSVRTLLAGIGRMPLARFLVPDVAGAAVWVVTIVATGFVLGESWRVANRYLGAGGVVVFVLLVLLFAVTWRRVRARVERELAAQEASADPAGEPDLDR